MYTKQIEKNKTNVYHTLERKRQSTMASVYPTRVKYQDLESQENRKYQQNLKVSWRQSLVPSLSSRNKTQSQQLNITVKQISKFFEPLYFCLISLLCPINVFRDSLREKCPDTEFYIWSVFPCIQSEYRKIRIRKKLRIWTLFTQ